MSDWTASDQRMYDSIVHNLRSYGWTKYDAMEEADIKMARIVQSRQINCTPHPSHTADCAQSPDVQKEDHSEG